MSIELIQEHLSKNEGEISTLVEGSYYFQQMISYFNGKSLPSSEIEWYVMFLVRNYQHAATSGIARQVDNDKGSITLIKTLGEIKHESSSFVYSNFLDLFLNKAHTQLEKDVYTQMAERAWSHFTDGDQRAISKEKIQADMDDLRAKTRRIKDYRHNVVGHTTASDFLVEAENSDQIECATLLEQLVLKYHLLVNGSSLVTLLPSNIRVDLKTIFKI